MSGSIFADEEAHALYPLMLTVNGTVHDVEIDPRRSLLDLVRETLGLKGPKMGCDHGQCGACTMIVNGRRINSCLSLAVTHEGDTVVTVEGLSEAGELHPLQQAFIDKDAFQCGFCTPGQLCSAAALVDEIREGLPSVVTGEVGMAMTNEEIRERMSGNLCRCGAYNNIVEAIRTVSGDER
ncbi:2Fe-2S iron-sulfur cluster-binding protein [Hoeflea alexandrii]|uniref:2Fe-2S iron-sulfur cluster-binding protein n=1 Tax=Hoeflea alexandrii TaxID=288436 RepID=UPI0035D00814